MINGYTPLLKRQVEEEILFLTQAGHEVRYPIVSCPFCLKIKNRNNCTRLQILKSFLRDIDGFEMREDVPKNVEAYIETENTISKMHTSEKFPLMYDF